MRICKIDVLGVPFDNVTLTEAVDTAFGWLGGTEKRFVVTPNPEIVQLCVRDPEAKQAVVSADLILPDGIGVIKGAAMLGRPLRERVPGYDFALGLMRKLAGTEYSVFLLGAKPGVAEEAAEKLKEMIPGLRIAGTNDGYFKEDAPVAEKIRQSGADVLFVCLGAPKQELWARKHAAELPCRLYAGLGGALDGWAGRVRRAPLIWQKMGLEWLYRMLKEPTRFKRFGALPQFLLAVRRQKRQERRK